MRRRSRCRPRALGNAGTRAGGRRRGSVDDSDDLPELDARDAWIGGEGPRGRGSSLSPPSPGPGCAHGAANVRGRGSTLRSDRRWTGGSRCSSAPEERTPCAWLPARRHRCAGAATCARGRQPWRWACRPRLPRELTQRRGSREEFSPRRENPAPRRSPRDGWEAKEKRLSARFSRLNVLRAGLTQFETASAEHVVDERSKAPLLGLVRANVGRCQSFDEKAEPAGEWT